MSRVVALTTVLTLLFAGCWDEPGHAIGANQDCAICHLDDYNATTDPAHVGVYPETCETCHSTDAWRPAFGAHPEEKFPISGGPHRELACGDCHDQTRLPNSAANTDCVGCHGGEHERAAMDALHTSRVVAGYPTGAAEPNFCLTCHPTGSADVSTHPEATFPITTGEHAGQACADCHDATRGVNGGGNTDCVGCHEDVHTRAMMDALHATRAVAGYPAGAAEPNFCLTCHPSGSADVATHPNDIFDITAGSHSGILCNECHDPSRGPNGAGNTVCVNCHTGEHARSVVDTLHRGVGGYPAGAAPPNFCLDCHPGGTADSIAHPEANFPIATGAHATTVCGSCHDASLGLNSINNTNCVGCHEGVHARSVVDVYHQGIADYPAGAAALNFCLTCHPMGIADALPHPEGAFPITRGPHEGVSCNRCHDLSLGSRIDGMNADCVGCHGDESGDHREVGRYSSAQSNPGALSPPRQRWNYCLDCHRDGRN